VPFAQLSIRAGLARSTYFVNEMSWKFALPAPAPAPVWAEPELLTPQLQASTSMPFNVLYFSSTVSPLILAALSKVKNMSIAIRSLLPFLYWHYRDYWYYLDAIRSVCARSPPSHADLTVSAMGVWKRAASTR